jgi:UDP-N-acetylmuramyl pentapeptide phosphotransferase/UDP-N-acetylglucosamine-1-phosphate transferase
MTGVSLSFLLVFVAAAMGTRVALAWLRRRQILDHPNERSSHRLPTPRGGGLAIVPIILTAWVALALAGGALPGQWPVTLAAGGLFLLSWQDDKAGLSARLRIAAHVLAGVVGLAWVPADQLVFQGLLPFLLDRAAALLCWVWFINLTNFMDGIDGITGVETAVVGLGLALLALGSPETAGGAPLAASVAAAGLGFLVWNWHPAKIFLGDSGSVPLGYLLGWLLLGAASRGHWAAALILPAYYLADATLTLLKRALKGRSLFQAHREHLYQKAVQGGATHARVVRLILGGDLLLLGLALAADAHPLPTLAAAALVVTALLAGLARLGRGS